MDLKNKIGFGIVIWIAMFAIISVFIAFNIYNLVYVQVLGAVIAGVISYILAGYVKPDSASLALGYGISWLVVGLILDYFVTMRFNPEIFSSWHLWLGYVLLVLAPLLRVKKTV